MHGWQLADGHDMRMTGYPGKVKSMFWSVRGRYLATSGAAAAILWPFSGKSGPMGQEPLQFGARGEGYLVTSVACHPDDEAIAIGYQDGLILASRFMDGGGAGSAASRREGYFSSLLECRRHEARLRHRGRRRWHHCTGLKSFPQKLRFRVPVRGTAVGSSPSWIRNNFFSPLRLFALLPYGMFYIAIDHDREPSWKR